MGGGGVRSGGGEGSQVECEQRIVEVFVKIPKKKKKKNIFFGGGGGGCEGVRVDVNKELKFFCENSKKNKLGGNKLGGGQGGGGGRGRVGAGGCVIEELKFLGKFTKKNLGGSVWGVRVGGVRVDVNEELKFL